MLLEVKKLFKKFGSVIAAENINFSMDNNEVIGIIGANGAGKTTFCNIITGYTKQDKGKIFFKGKDISNLDVLEIKNLGIHRSFQIPQVFDSLSVLENVMISNLVSKNKQFSFSDLAFSKENIDYAKFLLNQFNIKEYTDRKVNLLPQGARKILDILIAILGKPSIVLLDEPTSGISTDEKYSVMNHTLKAIKSFNISVLFIEHDMDIIRKYSKRVLAFYNGRIIADGNPQKALKQKDVLKYIVGKS
ncbi:MAG: Lipopolysaccharide export system ATP-binding protein LptB [Alphaproteobacteria bacterium MarineAlpha9_Bin4]|nr:ABC transporter ATP-binding protein [Pelagibacterales bacterium]PPR26994.1 MAG: Lipopolysaccharide export system ATP-binding protein LptB [Alphaproteobacteria bacterium MarineAlpha9_Bin4]|tara:strand:- start:911 stop:1651 length:741 start_codon:yes stop_codon:yes gene_type:complete